MVRADASMVRSLAMGVPGAKQDDEVKGKGGGLSASDDGVRLSSKGEGRRAKRR